MAGMLRVFYILYSIMYYTDEQEWKCIGPWDHWLLKILGYPESILSSHLQTNSGEFIHGFSYNILHCTALVSPSIESGKFLADSFC